MCKSPFFLVVNIGYSWYFKEGNFLIFPNFFNKKKNTVKWWKKLAKQVFVKIDYG